MKTSPPKMRNGTGENPNGAISWPPIVGGFFGWIQPQELLMRIPNTRRPRPTAESAAPPTSSFGRCSAAGAGFIRRRNSNTTITITTSPAKTYRQLSSVVTQPPMSGPAAIAAPATPPQVDSIGTAVRARVLGPDEPGDVLRRAGCLAR